MVAPKRVVPPEIRPPANVTPTVGRFSRLSPIIADHLETGLYPASTPSAASPLV